jgi:prepilin-type N-terminal cleavage/methylation domain-containing protein
MKRITGNAGFTLFEMMVVIAIMAIVAVITVPILLRDLPVMNLKSTARDIYSAMMQAKVEALKRGGYVTLLFDPANKKYTLYLDYGTALPPPAPAVPVFPLGVGATSSTLNVTILTTYVPTTRVTLNLLGAGGTVFSGTNTNALVFSPQGLPVSPANGGTPQSTQVVSLNAVDSRGAILDQKTVTITIAGGITIN